MSLPSRKRPKKWSFWLQAGVFCFVAAILTGAVENEPADSPKKENEVAPPAARLVKVSLPLAASSDVLVKTTIDRIRGELPEGKVRPVLVLEFAADANQNGTGSQFERALSLARYLVSPEMSRIRTVAYVHGSLQGHAVLPVMACEELIMAPGSEIGRAGVDEKQIDPLMRLSYREVADVRRLIPPHVAEAMLDKKLAAFRVTTDKGVFYVDKAGWNELEDTSSVKSADTIAEPEEFAVLSAETLRNDMGKVSYLAKDIRELASRLRLSPSDLEQKPVLDGQWNAIRIDFDGPVQAANAVWLKRGIRDAVKGGANFVCVAIDSPGGSPPDSLDLANMLAGFDPAEVRTVAYVSSQARADAALVALACDEVVMKEGATIGGPGEYQIPPGEMEGIVRAIRNLAERKHRDWSIFAAMIDPQLRVYRYIHKSSEAERFLSKEEHANLPDTDDWSRGRELNTMGGLTGQQAMEIGLITDLAENFEQFKLINELSEDPRGVEPNWAHKFIEKLASPWLSRTLLFFALFFLYVEFSKPGLGVGGFLSGTCFVLFFWANFLHGTAGWLEILLFGLGLIFVLIEIFVTPGIGIFGIGGALMMVISVILASQTFIIPQNSYQLNQLARSMSVVMAGFIGLGVSLVVVSRFLPHTPFFRKLMLKPAEGDELAERESRESLAHYGHLEGATGFAATRLSPAGKAEFGDETVNVVSDGDLISAGAAIEVIEVNGNRIVVREVEA